MNLNTNDGDRWSSESNIKDVTLINNNESN